MISRLYLKSNTLISRPDRDAMTYHLICKLILLNSLLLSNLAAATPFVIEIHGIEVLPTKTNGEAWDLGLGDMLKPDVQVRLSQKNKELWLSPKMMNTLESFRVFTTPSLELDQSQHLLFEVLDLDLRHTDFIESFKLPIPSTLKDGQQVFTLSGKSVIRLKVIIKATKLTIEEKK